MIYEKSWSSHLPLLIGVMNQSEGPVLELGAGLTSTPVLYWMCFDQDRAFVSYESNPEYAAMLSDYGVRQIDSWDQADIDSVHWGVVLIDHAPPERRHIDVARLKDNADHIVIHDSQRHLDRYFHYKDIYGLFKYRYKYGKVKPHTTVLSNFKEYNA
jgi:hypothetical protein